MYAIPYNGSGVFSVINTFIPGTTILSASVNQNFTDIATGLSDCLTRDGQAGMTAAFAAIAGSAGAPSITFTADTTTGIYLISAGNLGLTSSGKLGFTLNSAQVGIFAQSASGKLFMVLDNADATTSSNINTLATSGTGAISVGATTNWNTNGYLLVNNEVMSYTVASAAGLTINGRGQLGTTSVTQATGSTISMLYSGISQNSIVLPARATAGRPSNPIPGDFGFNSTLATPEYYSGSIWVNTAQQIPPQGYLSPTAGVPIITGDATSQTTIYYNPYQGNQIPVPTSGVFAVTTFSTAAIALGASQTTAGIYDIYAYASAGGVGFGVSPSWAAGSGGSVTPGSCARGTGAGGTQLTKLNGLYVNTTTTTLLGISTAAASTSIATASGVYLGSIYIGATAGTVNLHRSWGQSRQWGIWNAYNRTPLTLNAGDSTATWNNTTASIQASNASTANSLTVFSGLAEELFTTSFKQMIHPSAAAGANILLLIGVGWNSTSAFSGTVGSVGQIAGGGGATQIPYGNAFAQYTASPALGVNVATCLEQDAQDTGATNTMYGTQTYMLLQAQWRG